MNDSVCNVPRWQLAYLALVQRIDNGSLQPGDRLPTLKELSQEMGITIHASRRTMSRLKKEGRIESWQGSGHRVTDGNITYNFNRDIAFNSLAPHTCNDIESEVCSSRVTRLSSEVARKIELGAGTRVVETEILRCIKNRPVALSSNYIPLRKLDGVDEVISDNPSIINALGKFRVNRINPGISHVQVSLPTPHERVQLDIPSNQPVMITFAKSTDQHSNTIIAERTVWRGDSIAIEL